MYAKSRLNNSRLCLSENALQQFQCGFFGGVVGAQFATVGAGKWVYGISFVNNSVNIGRVADLIH